MNTCFICKKLRGMWSVSQKLPRRHSLRSCIGFTASGFLLPETASLPHVPLDWELGVSSASQHLSADTACHHITYFSCDHLFDNCLSYMGKTVRLQAEQRTLCCVKNLLELIWWSLTPVIQISPTLLAEWICSQRKCVFVLSQPADPTERCISADLEKIYWCVSRYVCSSASSASRLTIAMAAALLSAIGRPTFGTVSSSEPLAFFGYAAVLAWKWQTVDSARFQVVNCTAWKNSRATWVRGGS